MAVGAKFVNTVTWKEDLASRQRQLQSIQAMKNHINNIKKIDITVESKSVTSLNNKLQKAVDKVKKLNESGITIEVDGAKVKPSSEPKTTSPRSSRGLSEEEKAERWAQKRETNTQVYLLQQDKISEKLKEQYRQELMSAKNMDEFRVKKAAIAKQIREQVRLQRESLNVTEQTVLADGHVQASIMERVRLQKKEARERDAADRRHLKFLAEKEHKIDMFLLKQRKMSSEEKQSVKHSLMQAKNKEHLAIQMRQVYNSAKNHEEIERKITREMRKQNAFQRRMSGSFTQMATTGASVYTAYAGISSIIQTGMSFESINKMMLAVSANSKEAKDNVQFVKDLANETGTNLEDSGKAFARMLASSKGKMTIEESKELFTNLSKISVVMGMNRDATNRSFLAIQQMMNKGKVMSEELTGQLGENMPGAMQAMARAARDAGLLPKNAKESELEKHLLKAMENGEIMAKDVMPAFSKQLADIARNNDAFIIAKDENLSVRLNSAINSLKEFQDIMYNNGIKGAFEFVLDGFTRFMEEGDDVAKFLGGFASGVVAPFTFTLRLLGSAFLDVKYYMKQMFDVSEENADFWTKKAGQITGVAVAIFGLIAAYRKFRKISQETSLVKDAISEATGGDGSKEGKKALLTRRGHSMSKPLYVYAVNGGLGGKDAMTNSSSKHKGKVPEKIGVGKKALKTGLKAVPLIGTVMVADELLSEFSEDYKAIRDKVFSFDWMGEGARKDASYDKYMQKQAELFKPKDQEVKVNVNIIPDGEGMHNLIKAETDNSNKALIDRTYSTMYGR